MSLANGLHGTLVTMTSRDAGNAALRWLLSPACVACGGILQRPLDGPVCAVCWAAVRRVTPPYCAACGDPAASWRTLAPFCPRCRRRPHAFTVARSSGLYEGTLRAAIHAFKYGRRRVLARVLGAMMKETGAVLLADADAVVPVPLHPWRLLSRGFNQADDLARELGRPVWRVLRRRRHGPPQAGLPAARRHANVRQAYRLRRTPRLPALTTTAQVRGRCLVLVDDVMTTGATLDACARVLVAAGARRVSALTVARVVAGRPVPRLPTLPPLVDPRR